MRRTLRYLNHLLLVFLPASLCAQVLFPGNSSERRSRSYDVHHYKIVVGFDEEEKRVDGITSITLSPLAASMDSLVLDAEEIGDTAQGQVAGSNAQIALRIPGDVQC